MDLNFKWFALDEEKNDLNNVTQFLEDLPKNIEKLIDPNNSDIYEILKKKEINNLKNTKSKILIIWT